MISLAAGQKNTLKKDRDEIVELSEHEEAPKETRARSHTQNH